MEGRNFAARRSARKRRALWAPFAVVLAWIAFCTVIDGALLTVPGIVACVLAVALGLFLAPGSASVRAHPHTD